MFPCKEGSPAVRKVLWAGFLAGGTRCGVGADNFRQGSNERSVNRHYHQQRKTIVVRAEPGHRRRKKLMPRKAPSIARRGYAPAESAGHAIAADLPNTRFQP